MRGWREHASGRERRLVTIGWSLVVRRLATRQRCDSSLCVCVRAGWVCHGSVDATSTHRARCSEPDTIAAGLCSESPLATLLYPHRPSTVSHFRPGRAGSGQLKSTTRTKRINGISQDSFIEHFHIRPVWIQLFLTRADGPNTLFSLASSRINHHRLSLPTSHITTVLRF